MGRRTTFIELRDRVAGTASEGLKIQKHTILIYGRGAGKLCVSEYTLPAGIDTDPEIQVGIRIPYFQSSTRCMLDGIRRYGDIGTRGTGHSLDTIGQLTAGC